MYFYLNPEYYLITGATQGAIYNVIEGQVFGLNPQISQAVALAETGQPIEEIASQVEIDDKTVDQLLKSLVANGFGQFYQRPTFIQKLRVGSLRDEEYPAQADLLNKFHIELNRGCSDDCWYCQDDLLRKRSCLSCNRWDHLSGGRVSLEEWDNLFNQLKNLGYGEVIIGAGNISNFDDIKEILKLSREYFDILYLKIPPSSIKSELLAELDRLKIRPLVQLDLTQSLNQITTYLEELRSIDQLAKFLLITKTGSEEKIEIVKEKILVLNPKNDIHIDQVIQPGDTGLESSYFTGEKRLSKIDIASFFSSLSWNSCLKGVVTILANGDILPCSGLKSRQLGNIREQSITEIIRGTAASKNTLHEYWRLTKDKIERCQDCEFRYACTDCRGNENEMTGLELCNYNPYTGKWNEQILKK